MPNFIGILSFIDSCIDCILGANIPSMIRDSRAFRRSVSDILQKLASDFERAEELQQTFDAIRPIYEYNESWNFEEYRSQPHEILVCSI